MKTPPFLLGAALILWGWQTGLWIFALPIAIILEGSRWLHWRWDLSNNDLRRIANLCTIILLILIIFMVFAFVTSKSIYFSYTLFKWLPIVLFPVVVSQTYSISDRLDIRTLFLFLSKNTQNQDPEQFKFNLAYPYFALCILSASAANTNNKFFYIIMFILSSVALWFVRSKRFSPIVWILLIVIASATGFVGHIQLHKLHLTIEDKAAEWLSGVSRQDADPFQRNTAIGDLGKLKLSNDILFRVASEHKQNSPLLLRESTYNKYNSSIWFASNPQFTSIQAQRNGSTWFLGTIPPKISEITISGNLDSGKGLLKLPNGTFQIEQLPILKMQKNQYGVVKVEGEPSFISYKVKFDQQTNIDSPPTEEDLLIPNQEKFAVMQIVNQLDLENKSSEEKLKSLQNFFDTKFTYSLKLLAKGSSKTPLSAFLLTNRAGHCEYFATATTLILRAAGIPTRYAIGFSVNDFSSLEKQFIVRGKDAHAWTLVYINGVWQEFDTTPEDWSIIENAAAPKWQFIFDLWSFLTFKISTIFKSSNALQYWWLLIFPVGFLLIRNFGGKKLISRRRYISKLTVSKDSKSSLNSEFYLIESALNELGLTRQPSESLKTWIARLKEELPTADFLNDLTLIIELYYRDRFDPEGINPTEKVKLKSAIQLWLDKYNQQKLTVRN